MVQTIPTEFIKTIPAEFITGVDFSKFWEHRLGAGSLHVTPEKLSSAKQALLDAGVPARTVMYYFMELVSLVEAKDLHIVERVQYSL